MWIYLFLLGAFWMIGVITIFRSKPEEEPMALFTGLFVAVASVWIIDAGKSLPIELRIVQWSMIGFGMCIVLGLFLFWSGTSQSYKFRGWMNPYFAALAVVVCIFAALLFSNDLYSLLKGGNRKW